MIGIASFTKNGKEIEKILKTELKEEISIYEKGTALMDWAQALWKQGNVLIFIGATGIAVRTIAPFVKDKFTDPAVVTLDEKGKYCISLLSGHVGGGNDLAVAISEILKSTPIITTATDLNNVFAVDVFAKNNELILSDRTLAKEVSARILKGEEIPIVSEVEIQGKLPKGLTENDASNDLGIYIGISNKKPWEKTLYLVPKVVFVGIGCKKGKELDEIQNLYKKVTMDLNPLSISGIASINIKKDECGILNLCERENLPFTTYTADELLNAKGEFSSSSFVKSITGVDNVCERSAVLASDNGKIIMKKCSENGVTMATAVKEWSLKYE